MDGFDLGDAAKIVDQLKDKIGNPFAKPSSSDSQQWSIWANPNGPAVQPRSDASAPPVLPRIEVPSAPAQTIQLRPEQMVGTAQADQATKQSVYQTLDQARKQGNRTVAAGQFMQAITTANNSHDASLQAMSKVEYGLANMGWGYSGEGFKWILEAGSNNPSLYNPQSNSSFLQRLGQAGMPKSAVDLLVYNGQQDPNWYLKDPDATKKLDQAMTGPVFVAPVGGDGTQQPQSRPGGDPLAPPAARPDQPINPNLPQSNQAGSWMKEQFMGAIRGALAEKNHQTAFGLYKQATDLADRSGDKTLQATARVETGLALISWGSPEAGFKWLLDAGAKNPSLYDSRVNQAFQQRLQAGGLSSGAIDLYLRNGQANPNWHTRDVEAASRTLAAALRPATAPINRPAESPYLPVPSPFPIQQFPPTIPQPGPVDTGSSATPHIKPNPFGG